MKYDSLSLDRLRDLLAYDPETGEFTWKRRPFRNSRKKVGDPAGVKKGRGYLYIGLDNRTYLGSQLAWFYVHGTWPKGEVGVKDKNPANLRIENLFEIPTAPGKRDFGTREGRAVYRRAFKDQNPLAHRKYGFRRYYGIDAGEYQRMFVEQGGLCAICQRPERAKTPAGDVKWLSVDHCHNSRGIRGLLCGACNHMLGHAEDNPETLRGAADYLEQHAARRQKGAA